MTRRILPALAATLALGLPAAAQAQEISAAIHDRAGEVMGGATATRTASGIMMIQISLVDAPAGVHGVHIHEVGDCSDEDFTSAGGHIAGDAEHGVFSPDGPHPGDLPNLHANLEGEATVTYFNHLLTFDMLTDGDGAAIVIHEGDDNYAEQPSGGSGERLGCGVFRSLDEVVE
ncbi:superoxide dismutase family protein [Pseudoroseicyclus tamaricis]|uniref:Superoxide dismutase family protein n=1 Tax=Pseudoroseicyclus tamaricis TaxID=2705421 RepID=A0A6B2K511_9RHOB|nr:superoxide dismutase family protein [Pseudoroseicyclus tamaricis]NDV01816.1 superoxide dismutase family protein [Pseudoroseicyclus tamaricis]